MTTTMTAQEVLKKFEIGSLDQSLLDELIKSGINTGDNRFLVLGGNGKINDLTAYNQYPPGVSKEQLQEFLDAVNKIDPLDLNY